MLPAYCAKQVVGHEHRPTAYCGGCLLSDEPLQSLRLVTEQRDAALAVLKAIAGIPILHTGPTDCLPNRAGFNWAVKEARDHYRRHLIDAVTLAADFLAAQETT